MQQVIPTHWLATTASVVIRRSSIHGRGAFALVAIRQGTVIGISGKHMKSTRYTAQLETVDCAHPDHSTTKCVFVLGTFGRYLNEPTTCLANGYLMWSASGRRLFFVSNRHIRKGEELLIDYGEHYTSTGVDGEPVVAVHRKHPGFPRYTK